MSSLARRHRDRMAAQQLAEKQGLAATEGLAPEIAEGSREASEYNALKAELYSNLRSLQDIQSHEDRQPKKREYAATFGPWIEGVIAAGKEGNATQDEIVAINMIWAIDYQDYDYALDIADHVIAHGLILPEPYKRKTACLIAEDIAQASLTPESPVTHAQLLRTLVLTINSDMPDNVKAKLAKAVGRSYARQAEAFDPNAENAVAGGKPSLLTCAVDYLNRALQLNEKAGVKKEIEALDRQLKELGGRSHAEPQILRAGAAEETEVEGQE